MCRTADGRPTGPTGYYDVLSNCYVAPPFLEAVLLATAYPGSPVFVVLDEMNLAGLSITFRTCFPRLRQVGPTPALEQRAA